MAIGKFSLVMGACIAAFSLASTCAASPKARPTRRPLPRQAIDAQGFSNSSFPITQAPPDPSNTVHDTTPTSTCQTYAQCNLFYQYVSIYYWPTESQNTACLASLASPPPTPTPPGLNPVSPSIYAVFPSIIASDGCNRIGGAYGPITTSFAPGELSTIVEGGHSTKVFNFADLPCPPSSIYLPPGETYAPLIAPPAFIWDLDPAFKTCIPGYSQGVDPAIALPTGVVAGPGDPGDAPARRRDVAAHAHPHGGPWGPAMTAAPTLQVQL